MKILFIILLFFTLSCSTNKVSLNHGYKALESKYEIIIVNKSNKNDIVSLIGPPSSKSDLMKTSGFILKEKKQINL